MTHRRIDGYLSRKVQAVHADGLVYVEEGGPVEIWTLERPGVAPLRLGGSFGAAKQAVAAMATADRASRK